MRQVLITVAIVMPEIGLLELPMIPTIREDTVTKKAPKITISTPINIRLKKELPRNDRQQADQEDKRQAAEQKPP